MIQSAAIVDKEGQIYVARQYCEMTRETVRALYTAFPRLITKGKQNTIIKTNKVTYIYRIINDFYCVLITDRDSNIIEDSKTLSLFTEAITQYASDGGKINEDSILENRFILLFVFDELVSGGERMIENLSQLRTVMDMRSENEIAFVDIKKKKEKEAKAKAAEKSKELDQQRRNEMLYQAERMSRGGLGGGGSGLGGGISSVSKMKEPVVETTEDTTPKPARVMSRGRALKLKPKK